jgi:NAD-dependent deacetylase
MSLRALSEALSHNRQKLTLVVTGAGISLASGIPTFRGTDPGAIWAKDVLRLGTYGFFRQDPAASWKWYLETFDKAREAQPNPAHRALTKLGQWQQNEGGELTIVTQNVDLLHESAGSDPIKVHGSLDRVRCSKTNCELGAPAGSIPRTDVNFDAFLADPIKKNVPRCTKCQALLRQHVLWFDETYDSHKAYAHERAVRASMKASLVVFVGTSFAVGITDEILYNSASRGAPIYSIDPRGDCPESDAHLIRAKAEDVLPVLANSVQ